MLLIGSMSPSKVPPSFLQRLDEAILQRVAVGIIGRDEEPFLAELLHQFRRDRAGIHRRRVADPEHVPLAVGAGDRVGMAARHDVEDLLLVGHLRHRIGDAGVDVADDGVDVVAVDQLARLLHAGADVVGRILDQELNLAAQNAALLVDFGLGVFGAVDLALRQRRQNAGQRVDHADLDRLVGERPNDEWRADHLAGAERNRGFDERATANRGVYYCHLKPPCLLLVPHIRSRSHNIDAAALVDFTCSCMTRSSAARHRFGNWGHAQRNPCIKKDAVTAVASPPGRRLPHFGLYDKCTIGLSGLRSVRT